ncbi:hypothetical protein JHK85_028311 [Glycine max]|nr:hypothetical protein JHK85_028311 [Glycine max]
MREFRVEKSWTQLLNVSYEYLQTPGSCLCPMRLLYCIKVRVFDESDSTTFVIFDQDATILFSKGVKGSEVFDKTLVEDLTKMVDQFNCLAKYFRKVRDFVEGNTSKRFYLRLYRDRNQDPCVYTIPDIDERILFRRTAHVAAIQTLHRTIQSVGATGGVYKGQGRSQCELMTRAYKEFLVEDQQFQ